MSNKNASTERLSAINIAFLSLACVAILCAAANGTVSETQAASFDAAKSAVTLAINLIGVMALWLGLVRILEAGGFIYTIARWIRPLMVKLFPDVPAEHPAMGAMILNVAANTLGLGNAATPMGIKAMWELNKLNPLPGVATNAMCLFLAINTSSVALLPLGVIAVRAAAGASDPAAIVLPSLLATLVSTMVGVATALAFARSDTRYAKECAREGQLGSPEQQGAEDGAQTTHDDLSRFLIAPTKTAQWIARALAIAFFSILLVRYFGLDAGTAKPFDFSSWFILGLILCILSYGLHRGVCVYEAVIDGAKQGFEVAVRIIPYLVAILVAIAMFRASGAMELLAQWLGPLTTLIGMPAETIPMALVRPLSGSGAFAVMSSLVSEAPDSYPAFVASVMMGSTETTFYVLAVYFGAANVFRIRHALIAGLCADCAGVVTACLASAAFYQS